jgi:hypothetical protein
MPLLAALGELSYNGYSFDGTSQVKVTVDFVKDESQRTVVYHQHTIRVQAVIQNDSSTDDAVTDIRKRLGEQGKTLTFINQGFGDDLIVNQNRAGLRDVKWGPKPTILSWQPIGAARACEIEWQVVTCVPVCENFTRPPTSGVMAFNFDVSFAIDQKGYTTRNINGYLEIAQTRDGRRVPDSADAYLDRILVTIPLGFHRQRSRHLSADKSRLEFSITDTQIPSPNAFPPGVVDITCKHRVGHRRGSGLVRNVISAEIEMAEGWPTAHALIIFSAIANQRIIATRQAIGRTDSTSGGAGAIRADVLIDEFSIEEDVFSRRSSFTVGYRVPSSLQFFINDCGLWLPLPTNWVAWHSSIAQVQSLRGNAQMQQYASNENITDLCETTNSVVDHASQFQPNPNAGRFTGTTNQRPDPKNSWLKFYHSGSVRRRRPVARQSILQRTDGDSLYQPNDTTGVQYPSRSGTDDVIQVSGQNSYWAIVTGQAARAGWEIPRPRYAMIGGAPATEVDGEFQQAITNRWFGVPIYQAAWCIVYELPHSPGNVTLPDNPKDFFYGDGTAQS